ncbi:hypothetical protein [Streptomyces sp. BP-8]|uniref:Secreted protein n=1 Tax=Streptomyces sirii TaxID=3127701 RepID=A0ABZ2QIX3_9ACTN
MALSILPLLIGVMLLWKALDRPPEDKPKSEVFLQDAATSGVDPFTKSTAREPTPAPAESLPTGEPSPRPTGSPSAGAEELSSAQVEHVDTLLSHDAQKREENDVFIKVTGAISATGGALSGVAAMTVVRRASQQPEQTPQPKDEPPTS